MKGKTEDKSQRENRKRVNEERKKKERNEESNPLHAKSSPHVSSLAVSQLDGGRELEGGPGRRQLWLLKHTEKSSSEGTKNIFKDEAELLYCVQWEGKGSS